MVDSSTDAILLRALRLEQQRRGIVEGSILAREGRVKALMAWMAPAPVLTATRQDVELFLDSLGQPDGLKATTRRTYLSHLHAFFTWATDEGLIAQAPTARILRPKSRPALPRPISDAALARALAGASGQLRCFLLLAAYQGLRCIEIAGLEGEDVDRVRQLLFVRRGKGGKHRTLPLHPEVAAALPRREGPLFYMPAGTPVRPNNVSFQVAEYLHGLGITETAHSLRHAFATRLYRRTHDLLLTQHLLGHSSVATTQIYAAFDPAGAEAVRRLWDDDPAA
jgi:integrase